MTGAALQLLNVPNDAPLDNVCAPSRDHQGGSMSPSTDLSFPLEQLAELGVTLTGW